MPWTPKQVKYLPSKESPLWSKQEAKINVGTKFDGVFMDPDVAVDMAIADVNRKYEGPPEIVGVVPIRTDYSQTKWCPTIEKYITVKVEFDTKHDGVGLRA